MAAEAGTEARAPMLACAHKPHVSCSTWCCREKAASLSCPTCSELRPQARILVLSARAEPSAVQQALDAGATGYTLKRATDTDLLTAIRTVAKASAIYTRNSPKHTGHSATGGSALRPSGPRRRRRRPLA
jgi:DNA-binding NarL/FixJ family response regulator